MQNDQYNQLNTTNGSNQGFNQPPQQQGYMPPQPQQQQFNSPPQQVVIQSQQQGWACPACQKRDGFVDEADCCGLHCVLWWLFVPFGCCIYPCCCKGAHAKVRKCLSCQNKTTVSDGRCCN